MDLKRFFGVLRRHKLLMIGGTVLAVVAAALSYTKLAPEVWQSQSQLLITQGTRSLRRRGATGHGGQRGKRGQLHGVAGADLCRPRERRRGSGRDSQGRSGGQGRSHWPVRSSHRSRYAAGAGARSPVRLRAGAHKLAALAATTLENYVTSEQAASDVPQSQRVQFSFIQDGVQTKLLSGPSKVTSLLLFVVVLGCVMGLAFKLDKPRQAQRERVLGGPLGDRS